MAEVTTPGTPGSVSPVLLKKAAQARLAGSGPKIKKASDQITITAPPVKF